MAVLTAVEIIEWIQINLQKSTMIERPIKKSERQSQPITDSNPANLELQSQPSTDNNLENSDSKPAVESNPKSSKPIINRSSGTGKKASFGDENKQYKQQGNPALARGPKPVKLQPNVQIEPETESEPISEESQD
jgi:hypothetical protein